MYILKISEKAAKDIALLKKHGGNSISKKIETLLFELIEHPTTGTGQIERLKGNLTGNWSRRIDKKNRLIYSIKEEIVTVEVISAKGHYEEK